MALLILLAKVLVEFELVLGILGRLAARGANGRNEPQRQDSSRSARASGRHKTTSECLPLGKALFPLLRGLQVALLGFAVCQERILQTLAISEPGVLCAAAVGQGLAGPVGWAAACSGCGTLLVLRVRSW